MDGTAASTGAWTPELVGEALVAARRWFAHNAVIMGPDRIIRAAAGLGPPQETTQTPAEIIGWMQRYGIAQRPDREMMREWLAWHAGVYLGRYSLREVVNNKRWKWSTFNRTRRRCLKTICDGLNNDRIPLVALPLDSGTKSYRPEANSDDPRREDSRRGHIISSPQHLSRQDSQAPRFGGSSPAEARGTVLGWTWCHHAGRWLSTRPDSKCCNQRCNGGRPDE